MLQLKSEKEINIIRGKMLVNYVTNYEITEFFEICFCVRGARRRSI